MNLNQWTLAAVFSLIGVMGLYEYFKLTHSWRNGFLRTIYTFFLGLLWIAVPMLTIIHLGIGEGFRPQLVMGIIFLIWASDVGAYFVGSRFGKTKLAPSISPNKSWEGFAGGMGLALIVGLVVSNFFTDHSLAEWLVYAVLCVVFGTIGDLLESRLKRSVGAKDSGTILPGHGGFMDRFDSLFIVAPVMWLVLNFLPSF
ncbi:MAG: phosphatidate cytidylyltransferase [Limisphaerales bacterium]